MGVICQAIFRVNVFWIFLWAGLVGSIFPDIAFCHRVTVFAWVEGDMVHTESKVSGGKVLKNADIDVYDMTEKLLLQGKTDLSGNFTFKAPKKTDLKIVLRADMGHQAEWTVREEEFVGSEPYETEASDASKEGLKAESGAINKSEPRPLPITDKEALEKMIDKKLAPVLWQLSELREQSQRPKMKDIFGGIGYIIGLIGVAAYVQSRKK